MGLNLQDIHARFNAGISTVAIDSPTGAEISVVNHIAIEFLINLPSPRQMRVLLWDTARQLQTVTCPNSGDRSSLSHKVRCRQSNDRTSFIDPSVQNINQH